MIGKITEKRRMFRLMVWLSIIFVALIGRVFYLQFVSGEKLTALAKEQQSAERDVNPRRGTIYDCSGKNVLATSSTIETVTINPKNITEKEKVAKELSTLFDLDYDDTLKKVNKHTQIVNIAKKVEKDKTNELRKWMDENNIKSGINIDEDTKRYYPYNSLASQVIGFCGSDNQGINGIEAEYDDVLKGKKGSISRTTDASGKVIDNTYEVYNSPIEGDDIHLTIDLTLQEICEKYLKQACIDNECADGGNVIMMNPKTGEILAMCGYPNYNLNEPFKVDESLPKEEQNLQLQKLWRNKAISDTYEPGSTFKIVTASSALEEGIAVPDQKGSYCCVGYIEVAGVKMKCWRYYKPHGSESLRDALMNSCNPVFIGLGEKLGVKKYYEYLNKFGFFRKTGIDLQGEANSIFLKEEKVGPVELGTYAFGQRFEITPIQMITMLSTIANNGKYVKPHLVKQIISKTEKDENGNPVVKNIEPEYGEQVVSEQTAQNMLSMLQTVVDEGTGKKAKVEGYNIGGKTGTSEDGVHTGKYIASFMGVAPVENPQITLLVVLYHPKGQGGHSGGGVGATLAGNIFREALNYLN